MNPNWNRSKTLEIFLATAVYLLHRMKNLRIIEAERVPSGKPHGKTERRPYDHERDKPQIIETISVEVTQNHHRTTNKPDWEAALLKLPIRQKEA